MDRIAFTRAPGEEGFAIRSEVTPLKRFDQVSEASEPPSVGIIPPLGPEVPQ